MRGEGLKESSGVFMVAEQSAVDAVKRYAHSPLRRAEFYKAHGLYLDAAAVLDKWLAQHPNDPKAQQMKKEIEDILNPSASAER